MHIVSQAKYHRNGLLSNKERVSGSPSGISSGICNIRPAVVKTTVIYKTWLNPPQRFFQMPFDSNFFCKLLYLSFISFYFIYSPGSAPKMSNSETSETNNAPVIVLTEQVLWKDALLSPNIEHLRITIWYLSIGQETYSQSIVWCHYCHDERRPYWPQINQMIEKSNSFFVVISPLGAFSDFALLLQTQ